MKIGLALLTYNSLPQLGTSWPSYLQAKHPLTICVVDNASTDGTVAAFAAGGTTVHANPVNVGYSAGINQCFQHLLEHDLDWIAIVNPDVRLQPNWDELMLDGLTDKPHCGIIGARLATPLGSIIHSGGQITKPTLMYFPTSYELGSGWSVLQQDAVCVTQFRHRTEDIEEIEQVPWVSFAAVLLKTEMIRQVGMLDETYFLYASDAQYCMRALELGWETWYNPVVFVHEGSASVRKAGSEIQLKAHADLQRFALAEEHQWLQLRAVKRLSKTLPSCQLTDRTS